MALANSVTWCHVHLTIFQNGSDKLLTSNVTNFRFNRASFFPNYDEMRDEWLMTWFVKSFEEKLKKISMFGHHRPIAFVRYSHFTPAPYYPTYISNNYSTLTWETIATKQQLVRFYTCWHETSLLTLICWINQCLIQNWCCTSCGNPIIRSANNYGVGGSDAFARV